MLRRPSIDQRQLIAYALLAALIVAGTVAFVILRRNTGSRYDRRRYREQRDEHARVDRRREDEANIRDL
jgi:hypothetical protein